MGRSRQRGGESRRRRRGGLRRASGASRRAKWVRNVRRSRRRTRRRDGRNRRGRRGRISSRAAQWTFVPQDLADGVARRPRTGEICGSRGGSALATFSPLEFVSPGRDLALRFGERDRRTRVGQVRLGSDNNNDEIVRHVLAQFCGTGSLVNARRADARNRFLCAHRPSRT